MKLITLNYTIIKIHLCKEKYYVHAWETVECKRTYVEIRLGQKRRRSREREQGISMLQDL